MTRIELPAELELRVHRDERKGEKPSISWVASDIWGGMAKSR